MPLQAQRAQVAAQDGPPVRTGRHERRGTPEASDRSPGDKIARIRFFGGLLARMGLDECMRQGARRDSLDNDQKLAGYHGRRPESGNAMDGPTDEAKGEHNNFLHDNCEKMAD